MDRVELNSYTVAPGRASTPDPEVVPKAWCRKFNAESKECILAQAGACTQAGQLGALLRREGLCRPHLPQLAPTAHAVGLADARRWGQAFFHWYNHEHHHTGPGLLTPAAVHHNRTEAVPAVREAVLQQAYAAHPERFGKGAPAPLEPPTAVWINPAKESGEDPCMAEVPTPMEEVRSWSHIAELVATETP